MAAKGGLGRGLDALFMQNEVEDASPVTLKINQVVPNRDQPRHTFDDTALRELADSISQHGILQPLLVRPMTDGTYQLVAGERRWRAAQLAGLKEVPVVVREMSDQDAASLALIENLQREDLNPMEEALGYKSLMESYGLTQEETARIVNKSRPAVTNAMRLLALPEEVAEQIVGGKISAGHGRALLGFENKEDQIATANLIVEKSLSVRDVERLVKQSSKKPSRQKTKPKRDSFYDEVQLALKESLGRKVKVTLTGKDSGVLLLEFYSQEDLKTLANSIVSDDEKE